MHERKVQIVIILVLIVIAFVAVQGASASHTDRQKAIEAEYNAQQAILTKKCLAKWPKKDYHYNKCLKGLPVFRRDI